MVDYASKLFSERDALPAAGRGPEIGRLCQQAIQRARPPNHLLCSYNPYRSTMPASYSASATHVGNIFNFSFLVDYASKLFSERDAGPGDCPKPAVWSTMPASYSASATPPRGQKPPFPRRDFAKNHLQAAFSLPEYRPFAEKFASWRGLPPILS